MKPNKPYKVRCAKIGYWGQEEYVINYYYNYYWLANLRSWFMYNFFDMSCNTFLHNNWKGRVKSRPVVWK